MSVLGTRPFRRDRMKRRNERRQGVVGWRLYVGPPGSEYWSPEWTAVGGVVRRVEWAPRVRP